eukprot:CAMPEP_0201502540 /NCGR_PEP_ID=MMETSP0151_2-20130828/84187_1 /ASSEMBLY_ACC=CAM_ASM_000257 /TAXON_ID=200890 /ORGANISM="Paramoeba atlantica, Strain 621/1 / CCAP 1560/9" /LENGTH=633 /DNA_ID=CAMNT_0047896141 /DNA_START=2992 /DNA_END=4893 /DNA_ORIENTATION=-
MKSKPDPIKAKSQLVGPTVVIAYGTQSGTAEDLAKELAKDLEGYSYFKIKVKDLSEYEPENLPYSNHYLFLIVSTYTEGSPTESTKEFYDWVTFESANERSGNLLRQMKFGVFGLGNTLYPKQYYNRVSRTLDSAFYQMGAERIVGRGEGDESADLFSAFKKWKSNLIRLMQKRGDIPEKYHKPLRVESRRKKKIAIVDLDGDEEDDGEPVVDLEDMGSSINESALTQNKTKKEKTEEGEEEEEEEDDEEEANETERTGKTMISKGQRDILTKQRYQVVGGHSAVKMCRWTKSMLKGNGGCYKHTFYGIESHLCMETTPSLACANKCVFCWRHHKNPVGREWRWKMDPPEMIVDGAIANHVKMINEFKGARGVKPERLAEAYVPKHCALSLVGEPIIYPEINRFLDLLHEKDISSFLVTNAQFPEQMRTLRPVTQMYISVDAANPEELKKVDRPLFDDFWERFLGSIDALRENKQRTVFRMTLIKEYNIGDLPGYVKLIQRGTPGFVEVKGVTFCGGKKPPIGMKNVPWHEEVVLFCKELEKQLGGEYEIAAEHEHSCCVLLARKDTFLIDGKWHTWIDYARFQELIKEGKPFSAVDYMKPTPPWAIYGAEERGFDPKEFRLKARKPYVGGGC